MWLTGLSKGIILSTEVKTTCCNSSAGLSYVKVTPIVLATRKSTIYNTLAFKTSELQEVLNVILDSKTKSAYEQINADGYILTIGISLNNVTNYEVYLNGEFTVSRNCSNISNDEITLVLADEQPSQYKIVIFDNTIPTQTLNGKIYHTELN